MFSIDSTTMATLLVAIISSGTTFLVTKVQTKKDLKINDRNSLSEDEKIFRAELRSTIEEQRKELREARDEIAELRKEVAELHDVNLKLTIENKQFQIKVAELMNRGD